MALSLAFTGPSPSLLTLLPLGPRLGRYLVVVQGPVNFVMRTPLPELLKQLLVDVTFYIPGTSTKTHTLTYGARNDY